VGRSLTPPLGFEWGLAGVNIQHFSLYEWALREGPPGSRRALPWRIEKLKAK